MSALRLCGGAPSPALIVHGIATKYSRLAKSALMPVRGTSTTVLLIRTSHAQAGIPAFARELQAQLPSDVTMSTPAQTRYGRIRVDDAQR